MLLIYTPQVTNRLMYITGLIFRDLLGLELFFTCDEDEYLAFEGSKLCYGKCLGVGGLYIASSGLLFETGISKKKMNHFDYGDSKAFFPVFDTASLFPFDIFSASFFLISRYEEYLPRTRDVYGRFPAEESEAYKQGFSRRPLVNIWTVKLREEIGRAHV